MLINGLSKYLNFYSVSGVLGYGFRDNAGIMERKNSGGAWAAIGGGGGGGTVGPGTINEIAYFDTTTSIASLPVATYPSLTELTYLKGVTSAIQTQINGKQASLGFTPEDVSNKSTNVTTDGASDTKYPSVKAVKTYADGLVAGLLDYRGAYDASVNTRPAAGGSGTAGAVLKGDMRIISVAGTLGGTAVQIGDSVISSVDTPGQTAGNWNILNGNISYVPEDVANKVTSISGASTDTQYPSAKLIYDQLAGKQASMGADDNYVTDAQLVVIGNTSGTNTGDNATNTTSNSYADGKVNDTAYGAGRDTDTTHAPSKNAVYDKIQSMSASGGANVKRMLIQSM